MAYDEIKAYQKGYHCPECGRPIRVEKGEDGKPYFVCPTHGSVEPAEWFCDQWYVEH